MTTQTQSQNPTSKDLYTLGEEIFHSVTHGIGTGLSIAGLTLLVSLAVLFGDATHIVSFSIYGAAMIMLYLASTLYHSFQHPKVKQVFKVFDHAAIFLLIAGTYTPFLLVGIPGTTGWTLLTLVWVLAITGVVFKSVFIDRFEKLSVLAYILMGWLSVFAFQELITTLPLGGFLWLAGGGVVYTVGVIFYAMKKVHYTHAVWHLFVLGGSLCHFFAVLFYLAPGP